MEMNNNDDKNSIYITRIISSIYYAIIVAVVQYSWVSCDVIIGKWGSSLNRGIAIGVKCSLYVLCLAAISYDFPTPGHHKHQYS